jgi:hypothetical protein
MQESETSFTRSQKNISNADNAEPLSQSPASQKHAGQGMGIIVNAGSAVVTIKKIDSKTSKKTQRNTPTTCVREGGPAGNTKENSQKTQKGTRNTSREEGMPQEKLLKGEG